MQAGVVVLACVWCLGVVAAVEAPDLFPSDRLSPYAEGWHGSRRSRRAMSECQHESWGNRTYEEHQVELPVPESAVLKYSMFRFEDTVKSHLDNPISVHRTRYLLGSIAFVDNSYHTLSVLEPYEPGGCKMKHFSAMRSTVSATIERRDSGCKLAMNGGYFSMTTGQCLGSVVSDGRVVQSSRDLNANFGIREDGSLVVGYVPEEEILEGSFRQLISGVIWLVRNGTNYVNESMGLECPSHQATGKMSTFVKVLSARTAIGYDRFGRVVLAHIEGQTHRRGSNLYEFADLLIAHGVVNAINLDGGGSATFVHNEVLVNYPSDHCRGNSAYRCEREVSTVVCVHDVQCLEPSCNQHGRCVQGKCICDSPWLRSDCSLLNCSLVDCSNRGNCSKGKCICESGWEGDMCEKVCSAGRYGPGCNAKCWCHGRAKCDPVTGRCHCALGFTGFGCWKECEDGFYGLDCKLLCPSHNCSHHGKCSSTDGTCQCFGNWTGVTCNQYKTAILHSSTLVPAGTLLQPSTLIPANAETGGQESTQMPLMAQNTLTLPSISGTLPSAITSSKMEATGPSIFWSPSPTPTSVISCHGQPTQQNSSYAMTILVLCVVAIASVVAHLFICVRLQDHCDHRPAQLRRKKFRRRDKTHFLLLQESSSDCSI